MCSCLSWIKGHRNEMGRSLLIVLFHPMEWTVPKDKKKVTFISSSLCQVVLCSPGGKQQPSSCGWGSLGFYCLTIRQILCWCYLLKKLTQRCCTGLQRAAGQEKMAGLYSRNTDVKCLRNQWRLFQWAKWGMADWRGGYLWVLLRFGYFQLEKLMGIVVCGWDDGSGVSYSRS